MQRGLEVVEFACGIPQLLKGDFSAQVSTGVDLYSFREPLGVCVGITPFNFPAMVPMWMFPVAIACGNTFVLKPSERDPSASLILAELWAEAGLPDGVFNVVHGDKEAVDALLEHPDVAAVSFVGLDADREVHPRQGDRAGQAGAGPRRRQEPRDHPSRRRPRLRRRPARRGRLRVGRRALHGDLGRGHRRRRRRRPGRRWSPSGARGVKVGSGRDADSEMGPVVTPEARDRIVGLIGVGRAAGRRASRVDGRGLRVDGHEDGFFVGPTVVDQVTPEMDVYREEIFGPVLSVLHLDDVDQAIDLINANPYGNGTAIFTSSGEAARRFQRGVRVGMIGVNVPIPVPMAYYSFGGWKDSLFGEHHIHGPEGVAFYTRAKVVTARWPHVDLAEHQQAQFSFPTAR